MTWGLVAFKGNTTFKEKVILFESPYSIFRDWNCIVDEFTQGLRNFCLVKI